jgi:uncharacterized oxidoreductase
MNLTGNTIFITGGGSGIGRALAEALHKRGNKVIISGRHKGHLAAVVTANPGIEAIALDIADPDNINAVAKKLIQEYPALNVLINNAGIMERIRRRASSTINCLCRPSRPIFWGRSG